MTTWQRFDDQIMTIMPPPTPAVCSLWSRVCKVLGAHTERPFYYLIYFTVFEFFVFYIKNCISITFVIAFESISGKHDFFILRVQPHKCKVLFQIVMSFGSTNLFCQLPVSIKKEESKVYVMREDGDRKGLIIQCSWSKMVTNFLQNFSLLLHLCLPRTERKNKGANEYDKATILWQ